VIGLPRSVKILVFTEPTDMRKGFDGLGALVSAAGEDLYSGHLYVFLSRRRDRAKVLAFERGGFVLWYKRLEQGSFKPLPPSTDGRMALDATQLSMLLDGIDIRRVKAPRHWQPSASRSSCSGTRRGRSRRGRRVDPHCARLPVSRGGRKVHDRFGVGLGAREAFAQAPGSRGTGGGSRHGRGHATAPLPRR
jgi:transposase